MMVIELHHEVAGADAIEGAIEPGERRMEPPLQEQRKRGEGNDTA